MSVDSATLKLRFSIRENTSGYSDMNFREETPSLGPSNTIAVNLPRYSRLPGYQNPGLMGDKVLAVPSHPLGIKPAGNAYAATDNLKSAAGYFAALPDEILVHILEALDAHSLCELQCTCKALYPFTRLDELWKTLCIE